MSIEFVLDSLLSLMASVGTVTLIIKENGLRVANFGYGKKLLVLPFVLLSLEKACKTLFYPTSYEDNNIADWDFGPNRKLF